MKPAAFLKASVLLMGLAILSTMPVAEVLPPNLASAQTDVRQENRREERQVDRQQGRREDRRADRG